MKKIAYVDHCYEVFALSTINASQHSTIRHHKNSYVFYMKLNLLGTTPSGLRPISIFILFTFFCFFFIDDFAFNENKCVCTIVKDIVVAAVRLIIIIFAKNQVSKFETVGITLTRRQRRRQKWTNFCNIVQTKHR